MTTPSNSTKACPCGYSADSPEILPHATYEWIGYILMSVGISSCPTKVDFICPRCKYVFRTVTTREECNRYRYRV